MADALAAGDETDEALVVDRSARALPTRNERLSITMHTTKPVVRTLLVVTVFAGTCAWEVREGTRGVTTYLVPRKWALSRGSERAQPDGLTARGSSMTDDGP